MATMPKFNVQPQMVEGRGTEDDGKLWELTLRDGLAFHDGAKGAGAGLRRDDPAIRQARPVRPAH